MPSQKIAEAKRHVDNGTVNRALRILSSFASKDRWALNDLARTLNLPKASAHRLLNLCKPLGFVEQDQDGFYTAGIELYRIAGKLAAEIPINRLVDPLLQSIRDQTNETALLTLLARNELSMFFSHVASPSHPLRYTIECNRHQPLPWGAAGQSILAFMSEDEINRVIERREPSPLDNRALNPEELQDAIKRIRHLGYASSYSERVSEMHGIAVPFFDSSKQVRGNIMITIPHFRFEPSRQDELVNLLRISVAELTRRLGWNDDVNQSFY